jgi:phenylalanyl-tRNA synthetase alpha chain
MKFDFKIESTQMKEQLDQIQSEALAEVPGIADQASLEAFRIKYLGKKGTLTAASAGMRDVPKEEKPAIGQKLNEVRGAITAALDEKSAALTAAQDAKSAGDVDVTLPGRPFPKGSLHPLTQIQDRATQILRRMGFALAKGPEIETEWHCFDALNTPEDHPARNEKDTFYFDSGKLLRTHTSSVQIRTMEGAAPPLRIIAPGSAYRRDEIDATHLSNFNQLEGLYVDRKVTLGDLKGTLEYFFKAMFGEKTELRFRPHFFPFTEPSYEIDVKLVVKGKSKWLEMAGCGMVDPAVFEAVNKTRGDVAFDPDKVSGFAFGMGLDRLAMVKWGIEDIRLLIENDTRFLAQFA